jgi:hypothetical protein
MISACQVEIVYAIGSRLGAEKPVDVRTRSVPPRWLVVAPWTETHT